MEHIQYLLDEWCHTKFDEIHESVQLLERHGLQKVVSEDWTAATLPSWRDAILVALRDGRGLVWTADIWWRNTRDAYTILRFDSAFRKGLCQYGLFRGQKP
jgi:MPBQ/MSBQ methyltransferase